MSETVTTTHLRYRDRDGEPTCAADFLSHEVCEYYATSHFGTHEHCVLEANVQLVRRKLLGTLIPGYWCPLWREQRCGCSATNGQS